MKDRRTTLSLLSVLAMMLLLAASLTAILLDDGGAPYLFTTPRGEQVELYGGAGPYRFDNTYKAHYLSQFRLGQPGGGFALVRCRIMVVPAW